MVDAVFDRFDVAVEHRRISLQTGRVDSAGEIEPALRVAFMRANDRARGLANNLSAAARARIQARTDQLLNDVFVAQLVEMREMIQLDHREGLQMKLRILLFQRREQIGEIAER